MSLSEELISQIEQYIDGTMSPADRKDFEHKLISDPVLKEAVVTRQLMIKALKEKERAKVKEELTTMWQQSKEDGKVVHFNPMRRKVILAVASVFLIMVFYFIYTLLGKSDVGPQNLFEQYYEAFPTRSMTRSDDTETNEALRLYNAGSYEEAIPMLKRLMPDINVPGQLRLLLASSYLGINESETAREILTPLLNSTSSDLQNHGRWYIALSYLKSKDIEEAKLLLQELVENQGDYAKQAKALLADIDAID